RVPALELDRREFLWHARTWHDRRRLEAGRPLPLLVTPRAAFAPTTRAVDLALGMGSWACALAGSRCQALRWAASVRSGVKSSLRVPVVVRVVKQSGACPPRSRHRFANPRER